MLAYEKFKGVAETATDFELMLNLLGPKITRKVKKRYCVTE